MMKDTQKSKVYSWEDTHIAVMDPATITVDEAQDLVDFVWAQQGRNNPPVVRINKRSGASATRMDLNFSKKALHRWIVLHEIAHSLADGLYEQGKEGHGPEFVAIYASLLEDHLKLPKPLLWYTMAISGVKYGV
jgi:hypothetical protein